MRRALVLPLLVLFLVTAGCSRPREYELRGQVLAVHEQRGEITVKHEDIRGFMPGMTMPFKVQDAGVLRERVPGDLIRATLVVKEEEAYLRAIERVGFAELTEPPPPPILDVLAPGDAAPDVALVDERGEARRFADWHGAVVAVTFIYTRCPLPDFCPRMDRHFAAVQQGVASDDALRGRVRLLSVSFDPDHDTPEVLARYAAGLRADPAVWNFATGDRAEIDAFASAFGVSIIRGDDEQPHPDEILHNLRTAVIDPTGRIAAVLNGNEWTPGQLLEELRRAGGR